MKIKDRILACRPGWAIPFALLSGGVIAGPWMFWQSGSVLLRVGMAGAMLALALSILMWRQSRVGFGLARVEPIQVLAGNPAFRRIFEHAASVRSNLLAVTSDNLRQSVHALGMLADLAATTDGIERDDHFRRLTRCVDSVSDLLTQLIEFDHLDQGVYDVQICSMDLRVMAADVCSAHEPLAQARNVALGFAGQSASVRSDPVLLRRIVHNLVSNALQRTERGGVMLTWRDAGDQVVLEVSDTGTGLPPDVARKVFKAARPPGADTRGTEHYSGLKLSIVQMACKLLRHPIEFESVEGRGSRFRVAVPVDRQADPAPMTTLVPVNGFGGLEGLIVVVIEDDAAVLASLTETFRRWGAVTVAGIGYQQVARQLLLHSLKPSFVLSDFHLSGAEDGLDAICQLRKQGNPNLPAILLTGELDPAVVRRARAVDITAVHKPLKSARLKSLILEELRKQGRPPLLRG